MTLWENLQNEMHHNNAFILLLSSLILHSKAAVINRYYFGVVYNNVKLHNIIACKFSFQND